MVKKIIDSNQPVLVTSSNRSELFPFGVLISEAFSNPERREIDIEVVVPNLETFSGKRGGLLTNKDLIQEAKYRFLGRYSVEEERFHIEENDSNLKATLEVFLNDNSGGDCFKELENWQESFNEAEGQVDLITRIRGDRTPLQIVDELMMPSEQIPTQAIVFTMADFENIQPYLISQLDAISQKPNEFSQIEDLVGHCYILFILAARTDKRALESMIRLFSIPEKWIEPLFGIFLERFGGRLIGLVSDGETQEIIKLIKNEEIGIAARKAFIDSLCAMYALGKTREEEFNSNYKQILKYAKEACLEAEDGSEEEQIYDELCAHVFLTAVGMNVTFFSEEIEDYKKTVFKESPHDFDDDIEYMKGLSPEEHREQLQDTYKPVEDVLSEILEIEGVNLDLDLGEDNWEDDEVDYEYDPSKRAKALDFADPSVDSLWKDEPDQPITIIRKDKKVGRNDPCPCGSGKKYKKCCNR